jgi:hypothetical protein
MDHLQLQSLLGKLLVTVMRDSHSKATTVLALATLGSATKNINDPICVTLSNEAKASTIMTIACHCP